MESCCPSGGPSPDGNASCSVMPALVAGIHVFLLRAQARKSWMAGTSPATTTWRVIACAPPLWCCLVPPASLLPRQIMREVGEVRVGERLDHVRHLCIVAAATVVLVAAQRLEEVVLALTGEPRHVLDAGEVRQMADVAAMPADQRQRARRARGLGGRRIGL